MRRFPATSRAWPAGEDAGPLVDAFHRLGDFTSAIGQAVALSFLAYVAGAVSEALFDRPLKWAAVRLRMNLPARRMEALRAFIREKLGAPYESMRWAVTTTPSYDPTEATSLAKSFAKKFAPAFVDLVGEGGYRPLDYSHRTRLSKVRWWFATRTPPSFLRGRWPRDTRETYEPYSDRGLEQMLDATASLVVERDLESVEFRLLREHKDLYLEADRLRAEAEFRFAVAVPLLVLPAGVLIQELSGTSVLIAAGAVAAAVVLFLSGLFRNAIEDALRTFAADEILVVAHPEDQAGWLEEGAGAAAQARFSLPITRVTVADDGTLARPGG